MVDLKEYTLVAEAMRSKIHALCYRMTGSYHDAEDLTQETFLLAWRHLPEFRGDSSIDTWLYRIATNLCLSFLRTKKRRGLPGAGLGHPYRNGDKLPEPDGEAVWLEPYPTPEDLTIRREKISLAFLTLLQAMPPRQRAVFILMDVLEYSAKETAAILECTVPAINSALQRARRARGSFSEVEAIAANEVAQSLEQYVAAWELGDAEAIVALVRADATMVMPPYPVWVHGKDDIRRVLIDYPMNNAQEWKLVPTQRANGDFAFGFYKKVSDLSWQGWGVQVVSFEQDAARPRRISNIYVFKGEQLLSIFGLKKEILPS